MDEMQIAQMLDTDILSTDQGCLVQPWSGNILVMVCMRTCNLLPMDDLDIIMVRMS